LDGRDLGAAIFGLGILNQSIEVMERIWPITFESFAAVSDSPGAGRWRGGAGVESLLRFENAGGARVSYVADRGARGPGGPPGLFGGHPGSRVRLSRDRGTEHEQELEIYFADEHIPMTGTFFHVSSGGGGYGDPLERDPAAVLEDVMDRFVSVQSARDDYGVVIQVGNVDMLEYTLDHAATAALRAERAASPQPSSGVSPPP
jgi:N-methylhydantoinase B